MNIPRILIEMDDMDHYDQFITDVVADCVHGVKLGYLSKYPEITHYQQVIEAQAFLQELSEIMLELNKQDEEEIAKLIEKIRGELTPEKHKILAKILKENYQGLCRRALYQQIAMSKYILKDFNWNLNVTVSSDKIASCQKPTLILELLLDTLDESKGEKLIVFEMNKLELELFLTKLQKIKTHFQ